MIMYEFLVWEHYRDSAPEPFGSVFLDHVPVEGELITLYWGDGRKAYDVRVLSACLDRLEIHAEHPSKALVIT